MSDTDPDPTDRENAAQRTASIHLARPGDRLPGTPYQLIARLGGGGMGQVFRAEHIELGREVAIKLLAPALAHDPKAMERLRREARAAARLGNPHIIDVYDLGITDDGRPYVVMKLIDGRDLKALGDEEAPLDPRRVVLFAQQIGDALKAAHAAGVVHRDLKPENVLVERRGDDEVLTVLDFGIAQSIQDTDTRLTRDGQMIGTPGYMAPEQALARPLDGRADQYALSVMAYELISGRSPFDRLSPLQLIAAQLTEEPAPLGDVVDRTRVPDEMVAVIMRGLARDPELRYPEVGDFVDALAEAADRPIAAPMPTGRPGARPKRSPMIAVAIVALLGAALGAFIVVRGGDDPGARDPAAVQTETQGAGEATAGAQSPDPTPALVEMADGMQPAPAADAAPSAAIVDAAPEPTPDAAPTVAVAAPRQAPVKRRRSPRPAPRPKPTPEPPEPKAAVPEPPPPEPPPPEPAVEPTPPPTAVAAAPVATPEPPPPPPEPAAPPVLSFGSLDVIGGASARNIRRAVSGGFPDIKSCVAGAAGLKAGRRATVRFVIDADGFFGSFGGDGDPALVKCGTRVLRRINRLARRPDTGDIRVALPMRLEAP